MKGWLDNFGKADNANDSNVSLPEGFVGVGYNTEGRNYSPAWGGQFAMGGSLPGATGMMYARYQQGGLIPIAQNGVSEYMKKKMQEKEDEGIAAQYDLPEVVVQGYKDRNYSVFDKAAMMPEYTPVPTVPYLEKTKDPAEFFKSWITSPEYRKRKIETGYQEYPEYNGVIGYEEDNPNLGPLIDRSMRNNFLKLEQLQRPGAISYDPTKRSEYFEASGTANINPKDFNRDAETVRAHEIAHAVDTMEANLSQKEIDILRSSTEGWGKRLPDSLSPELWSKVQDAQHLEKPRELRADLNAIRFLMYDKDIYDIRKGKEFTKEDLEKAKEKLKGNQSLDRTLMLTGDDNLIRLMNIIAKGDEELTPIAMNGASMPGSVGFTYAREAGAAPSKGKYAKKTMASAQSGIMAPMLLARNVLNYFYPGEEATPTVSAAPVEYKKGLTDELLKRQAYKESTFNPAAVSPAGYKGLTQIGEEVLTDYSKKKGGKKLDPFNPKDAVELQKFAMDDLYNASFINKPDQPDSVRIAKTLAAYNWGRGNLFNYLNEQKQKGVDIYDSYDWLNDLPKETSDYVNKILLQEDQSFNKNYKRDSTNPKYKDITSLYGSKEFGGDIPSAQNGQEMKFYQNGLDWKPKSMQNGGEESLIGKATKFVSEEISDPVTTAALGLLNKIKPLSNTEVYKTVRPVDYPNALKLPMYAYDYVMGNESEPLKTKSGKPHLAEEFWATAMNIPGERQYLKESQYKPSKSKDPNAKYYTIRDVIDDYQLMNLTKDLKPGEKMQMNGLLPILDTKWYSQNANTDKGVDFDEIDPLQRFTLQKSDDGSYVSIYDKYDFNNPALNRMMNTIEIYDRFYLPKKKDGGGIVKDNQGYWNPENWGKPVEIDSNNITMEGVYEPLLGVSDTGDTKLMKPGKNYKFKGKKVTEFPVAKLGINQLDAQPMKKLNQLLNFTNNPDKDNWLDKYN